MGPRRGQGGRMGCLAGVCATVVACAASWAEVTITPTPTPTPVRTATVYRHAGVVELRTIGGVRVWVRPMNTPGKLTLWASMPGVAGREDERTRGWSVLGALASEPVIEGPVRLALVPTPMGLGVRWSGSGEQVGAALGALARLAQGPCVATDRLDRARLRLRGLCELLRGEPERVLFEGAAAAPPVDLSSGEITWCTPSAVCAQDLGRWLGDAVRATPLDVVLAGDITPGHAERLVREHLGAVERAGCVSRPVPAPSAPPPWPAGEARPAWDSPAHACVIVMTPGPVMADIDRLRASFVAARTGEIELRARLARLDLGALVGIHMLPGRDARGVLVIDARVRGGGVQADEVRDEIHALLTRWSRGQIDESVVQRAGAELSEEAREQLGRAEYWAGALLLAGPYALDPEALADAPGWYARATPGVVLTAAAALGDPARARTLVFAGAGR